MRAQVVVIGAGLAGLSAALRAAEGGCRVALLAKGVGATHLAPGTVDVLGYAPARVDSPAEALPGFIAEHPDHPYARVGVEGIESGVEWLREKLGHMGDLARNTLLPTAVGAVKPSALVPQSLAKGDLRESAPICVVSPGRLRDFHPAYCAENLSVQGHPARGLTLDLPLSKPDENALGLARAFEDADFRSRVVRELGPRLEAGERVGFPAVLGLTEAPAVRAELEQRLGRDVFEIPMLPPSVPGIRAHRALEAAFKRAGGRVVMHTEVVGVELDGRRVSTVLAHAGARDVRWETEWVVLANGGVGSGGIALDSRWRARETALGLPLRGVPAPEATRFGPDYFGEHPFSRAGVGVDQGLRPVGPDGERVYENVLVAGATLQGASPWREKSGDGISLSTGHRAGELVAAEAPVGAGAA